MTQFVCATIEERIPLDVEKVRTASLTYWLLSRLSGTAVCKRSTDGQEAYVWSSGIAKGIGHEQVWRSSLTGNWFILILIVT